MFLFIYFTLIYYFLFIKFYIKNEILFLKYQISYLFKQTERLKIIKLKIHIKNAH